MTSSKVFMCRTAAQCAILSMLIANEAFADGGFLHSKSVFKGVPWAEIQVDVSETGPWGPQGFTMLPADWQAFFNEKPTAERAAARSKYFDAAKATTPAFTMGDLTEVFHWFSAAIGQRLAADGTRVINGKGGTRLITDVVPKAAPDAKLAEATIALTAANASVAELSNKVIDLTSEIDRLKAVNVHQAQQLEAMLGNETAPDAAIEAESTIG